MLGEEFYVITDSGQTGPYRTVSQAWSALLNTSGSIVCHNHFGDPDIPEVFTVATHHPMAPGSQNCRPRSGLSRNGEEPVGRGPWDKPYEYACRSW
jgi:hypothetical protein